MENFNHPFNRSGLAALSDFQTKEWLELFYFLEKEQENFFIHENQFRSPEYKWPRDPLHTWSRVWEYPYAYHHLKKWRAKFSGTMPFVVDLGSGVTFFPFSVARLGYHVTCIDIDPVCERDFERASQYVSQEPGKVDFRLANSPLLPFPDGEADIVYCISVLEHIDTFELTISEIARILKPGGFLLLTIDLDLRGDSEIGVEKFKALVMSLNQFFHYYYPDSTIHPADVLHSSSGPYAHQTLQRLEWVRFIIKQRVLKPLVGRKPAPMPPFHLAVQGFVMTKLCI